jgi:predicted transcriptional regulator
VVHRREVRLPVPVLPDSRDPFEVELRIRLEQLASRARDTRRLVKSQASFEELESTAPLTADVRAWSLAASDAIHEFVCSSDIDETVDSTSVDDPPAMVMPKDGVLGSDVLDDFKEAKRALHRALDIVDAKIEGVLESVRMASDTVTRSVEANYAWLRDHAALLGIQCSSSSRCPVCLVNQVSRFNDPCGHTLCTTCMHRSGDECHMCREPVRHRRRLFGCH